MLDGDTQKVPLGRECPGLSFLTVKQPLITTDINTITKAQAVCIAQAIPLIFFFFLNLIDRLNRRGEDGLKQQQKQSVDNRYDYIFLTIKKQWLFHIKYKQRKHAWPQTLKIKTILLSFMLSIKVWVKSCRGSPRSRKWSGFYLISDLIWNHFIMRGVGESMNWDSCVAITKMFDPRNSPGGGINKLGHAKHVSLGGKAF